jgi:hypothetical protein
MPRMPEDEPERAHAASPLELTRRTGRTTGVPSVRRVCVLELAVAEKDAASSSRADREHCTRAGDQRVKSGRRLVESKGAVCLAVHQAGLSAAGAVARPGQHGRGARRRSMAEEHKGGGRTEGHERQPCTSDARLHAAPTLRACRWRPSPSPRPTKMARATRGQVPNRAIGLCPFQPCANVGSKRREGRHFSLLLVDMLRSCRGDSAGTLDTRGCGQCGTERRAASSPMMRPRD